MCDIMEELNRRAAAEARAKAIKERDRAIATVMLRNGKLTREEVSAYFGLSPSEVDELIEKLNETEKLCV